MKFQSSLTSLQITGLLLIFGEQFLDQKATGGGWFDRLLKGNSSQVERAVAYLKNVGVEIWNET